MKEKVERREQIEKIIGSGKLIPLDLILASPRVEISPTRRTPLNFEFALNKFGPIDQERIRLAKEFAEIAHKGQKRESGERFSTHPMAVFLILVDECNIYNADMACAAFLHDQPEDSEFWGKKGGKSYSEWSAEAMENMTSYFGNVVATMVMDLTIPIVDRDEVKTKEEAKETSYMNLMMSYPETILIKMADRLHNLRTLKFRPENKQRKVIKETRRVYIPLLKAVKTPYPQAAEILLEAMEDAIRVAELDLERSQKQERRKKKKYARKRKTRA